MNQDVKTETVVVATTMKAAQLEKEYFIYSIDKDKDSPIVGTCNKKISQDEQTRRRAMTFFEEEPLQKISRFERNRTYRKQQQFMESLDTNSNSGSTLSLPNNSKNSQENSIQTRTPEALLQSLNYLIDNVFPLCLTPKQLSKVFKQNQEHLIKIKDLRVKYEKYKNYSKESYDFDEDDIFIFLDNRLKAIKSELCVQGLIWPRVILKILKCEVFLSTVWRDFASDSLQDGGVQYLFDGEISPRMAQEYPEEFHEMLQISIYLCKRGQLERLVSVQEELIFEGKNSDLRQALSDRMNIERGNYWRFFSTIDDSPSMIVKGLLWTHIKRMRVHFIDVLKAARLSMPREQFNKFMGLVDEKGQIERGQRQGQIQQGNVGGFIDIHGKDKDYFEKPHKFLSKPYRKWFSLAEFCQQLLYYC